jgi:hypothetical protein
MGISAITSPLKGLMNDSLSVPSGTGPSFADHGTATVVSTLQRYGPTTGELAVARLVETAMDVSIRVRP